MPDWSGSPHDNLEEFPGRKIILTGSLINVLDNSSKHDSPKYGQHYTPEEVIDIFAPSQASVDAVRGWLEGAGIEAHRISQSVNKQWLQFEASTKEVESLLYTKYHIYKHAATGKSNVACDEYVYWITAQAIKCHADDL